MTELEVTREQAQEYAEQYDGDPRFTGEHEQIIAECARTLVALYDQIGALLAGQIQVAIEAAPLSPSPEPVDPAVREQVTDRFIAGLTNERAQRECIDRLCDGWYADHYDRGPNVGVWFWWKPGLDNSDEPMTPEQQAVMAR